MIGKIQDVVSAAAVISAADNAQNVSTQNQSSQDNTSTVAAAGTQTANASTGGTAVQSEQKNDKSGSEQQKKKDKLDEKSVSNMTKELNELMGKINCDLEFQYHKEVNVMSVKMIDKNTKEVLREYPPEDMIKGMIKAKEWIGAFIDKNA